MTPTRHPPCLGERAASSHAVLVVPRLVDAARLGVEDLLHSETSRHLPSGQRRIEREHQFDEDLTRSRAEIKRRLRRARAQQTGLLAVFPAKVLVFRERAHDEARVWRYRCGGKRHTLFVVWRTSAKEKHACHK